LKLLIYFLLGENTATINNRSVIGNKIVVGIANDLNGSGIAELEIQIFQNNVEPLIKLVNLSTFVKHILRSEMGDPNLGCNGEEGKVGGLSRHANLTNSFKKTWGNSIPRASAESLQCTVLSLKYIRVGREEGGNVGEFGNGKHIVEGDLSKETTVKGSNEPGSGKIVTQNMIPVLIKRVRANKNAEILQGLKKLSNRDTVVTIHDGTNVLILGGVRGEEKLSFVCVKAKRGNLEDNFKTLKKNLPT